MQLVLRVLITTSRIPQKTRDFSFAPFPITVPSTRYLCRNVANAASISSVRSSSRNIAELHLNSSFRDLSIFEISIKNRLYGPLPIRLCSLYGGRPSSSDHDATPISVSISIGCPTRRIRLLFPIRVTGDPSVLPFDLDRVNGAIIIRLPHRETFNRLEQRKSRTTKERRKSQRSILRLRRSIFVGIRRHERAVERSTTTTTTTTIVSVTRVRRELDVRYRKLRINISQMDKYGEIKEIKSHVPGVYFIETFSSFSTLPPTEAACIERDSRSIHLRYISASEAFVGKIAFGVRIDLSLTGERGEERERILSVTSSRVASVRAV